jgi:hypothetical protein
MLPKHVTNDTVYTNYVLVKSDKSHKNPVLPDIILFSSKTINF